MNATVAALIERLKCLDYSLRLEGERVTFRYAGDGKPPEAAKALLDAMREHKAEVVIYLKEAMPRPYLEPDGGLVIPFGSDPRYHWWAGGQSVAETMKEITDGKECS